MSAIGSFDKDNFLLTVDILRDSEDGEGFESYLTVVRSDRAKSVHLYTADGDHTDLVHIRYSEFSDFVDSMIEMREAIHEKGLDNDD